MRSCKPIGMTLNAFCHLVMRLKDQENLLWEERWLDNTGIKQITVSGENTPLEQNQYFWESLNLVIQSSLIIVNH